MTDNSSSTISDGKARSLDEDTIGKGTWIDKLADRLLSRETMLGRSLEMIRVESGLGASGIPHLGSLGDAARAYAVKLALEYRGYSSKLIAYSDDLDGLRKIPQGFPESLEKEIAKPVSLIPDPYGEYDSYGDRMSNLLREGLDSLGIQYEFQSAKDAYEQGLFYDEIDAILSRHGIIGERIAEMVGQEKFKTHLPYFPVCAQCRRLYTAKALEYIQNERCVRYECQGTIIRDQRIDGCGYRGEADISKDLGKLAWKVEFAARWRALNIRFEAYGKDIMDSVDVNDWVSSEILNYAPPAHVRYEMFLDKGGKKISKSSGNVVTSQRWLRYATPQSILLLLYKRISGARELGFEDIPSLMVEYNDLEDIYFGKKRLDNETKGVRARGLYQYVHLLCPPDKPSVHINYRLLLELCRAFKDDRVNQVTKRLINYGIIEAPSPDTDKIISLAGNYADDFEENADSISIDDTAKDALLDLARVLTEDKEPEDLQGIIFEIARSNSIPAKNLFRVIYQIILGTDRGPRLGPLIMDIGRRKIGNAIKRQVA